MSRSRKKHPVHGWACCQSERWDKFFWHKKLRQRIRMLIKRDMESEIWPHVREVSNPCWFGKDGKVWVKKQSFIENYYNIRKAMKK